MKHNAEALRLVVSHDGQWTEGSKNNGIGMRTIDDRLKTIGGTYSVSMENGVSVNIDVNLLENVDK